MPSKTRVVHGLKQGVSALQEVSSEMHPPVPPPEVPPVEEIPPPEADQA